MFAFTTGCQRSPIFIVYPLYKMDILDIQYVNKRLIPVFKTGKVYSRQEIALSP